MRHTYDLTSQTQEALDGHVKEISYEMNVSDKYLYSILSGQQTDPFAPFKHLFRSVARVTPNGARLYLNHLKAIYEQATRSNKRSADVDLSDMSGDIGKEYLEFIESQLKGKPVEVQRKECRDIIEAACEALEQLDEAAQMEGHPLIKRVS